MHLSIDKLDSSNYATWALDIKLWLKSYGYVDHITQKSKDQQHSSSIVFVACTGTSFVSLTQSSSLSPWLLDSRVTDHIPSNISLFSSSSSPENLPFSYNG